MTAPTLDESKPAFGGNPVDADLLQLRNNVTWILAMVAANNFTIPPWAATPAGADLSKPTSVELVHPDGRKIKATFTYTGDDVTTIVFAFDDTSGYVNFANGTATLSYNASGDWTGTVWS
jgi:hypothetical protein